jgi:hypothetical protein
MPMPTPRSAPELVSAATVGRIAHPLEVPVVGVHQMRQRLCDRSIRALDPSVEGLRSQPLHSIQERQVAHLWCANIARRMSVADVSEP